MTTSQREIELQRVTRGARWLLGAPLRALRDARQRRRTRQHGRSAGARLVADVATLGWVGHVRRGGGTLAALAALPFGVLLALQSWPLRLAGGCVLVALSTVLVSRYCLLVPGASDPQEVVLDEVVGQVLALLLDPWGGLVGVSLAFALFRLLDITKPWPISAVERRLSGGAGVVLDDVAAGLAAGGLLRGARWALAAARARVAG